MIRAEQKSRAFSLIEVLIAIFVLAFGLIGLAAVFPAVIKQQQDATDDRVQDYAQEAIRDMFDRISNESIDWRFLHWDPFLSSSNLGENCRCDSGDSYGLVSVFGDGCVTLDPRCHPESVLPKYNGRWEVDWSWPKLEGLDGVYQQTGNLIVGDGSIVLCTRETVLARTLDDFDGLSGSGIRDGLLTGEEITLARQSGYIWMEPAGCEPSGDYRIGSDDEPNGLIDVKQNSNDTLFRANIETIDGAIFFSGWMWNEPVYVQIADLLDTDATVLSPISRVYPEPFSSSSEPLFVWDFVPRKLLAGTLECAVFVRRIDSEIPVPPGSTLSEVLVNATRSGTRLVFPVGETSSGVPNFNGSGNYSMIRQATFRLSKLNSSVLELDPANNDQAVYVAQKGQHLIDEGIPAKVQEVIDVKIEANTLYVTLFPGYGEEMANREVNLLYTPQLAVDAFVKEIPCGGN